MRKKATIPAVLALVLLGPALTAAPAWSQDPAREGTAAGTAPEDAAPEDAAPEDAAPDDTAADDPAPAAPASTAGEAEAEALGSTGPETTPADLAGGAGGADSGAPEGTDSGAPDDGDTGATEAASPAPWPPSDEAARFEDGVPVLGPWPDDWVPERTGQAGLPVIDPLTRDVLDPGAPYVTGPEAGPALPAELLGPVQAGEAPPAPPAALQVDGPAPAVAREDLAAPAATPAPMPAADGEAGADTDADAAAASAAPATTDGGPDAPSVRRSIAEDFLPPPPPSGGHRAVGYALLALLAFLSAALTDRLQRRVPGEGLVARVLSAATGIGRGVTVPLLFISALSLLPRSWSLAAPFALVALALAFGWTTRDLLSDVFAGIVLTIERRVQSGDRVEVGDHKGVVQALGLRTTRMTVDDGRMVTIPNRRLLAQDMRVDPDSYAPVKVPVNVHPHLSVGEVRQQLQELALLSPYIAPSRPPNVYRDADRPEIWIVEARLVHPRFANAFRGALVELADQVFAGGEAAAPDAPRADDPPRPA